MKIEILSVGDHRISYFKEAEADYLDRLAHYCPVEMIAVKGEKITSPKLGDKYIIKEGKQLINRITPGSYKISLDRHGLMLTSIQLSRKIEDLKNRSIKKVVFLIGGPLGLSHEVLNHSDFILSFSKMTFSHTMMRFLVLEQIYRSFTITKGEKYHK